MDLDTPTLFISDVSHAAGIDLGLLRGWINRGFFPLGSKSRSDIRAARLLTIRTGYAVAIAARLVEHGLAISRASMAAQVAAEELTPFLAVYTTEEKHRGEDSRVAKLALFHEAEDLNRFLLDGSEDIQTVVNCRKIIEQFDNERG
ncbi:hypothetical protein ACFOYU_02160 [Microvirga sp. GCM10011540]|uniref:hypothetical protein n=1 Tax=Microvirga sp. GCM10011540 TaxID=3317338 RepID=UPI0036080E27